MNKNDIEKFLKAKGDKSFAVYLKNQADPDEYAFEISGGDDTEKEFELLEESVLVNEYETDKEYYQQLVAYDQIQRLSTNY